MIVVLAIAWVISFSYLCSGIQKIAINILKFNNYATTKHLQIITDGRHYTKWRPYMRGGSCRQSCHEYPIN